MPTQTCVLLDVFEFKFWAKKRVRRILLKKMPLFEQKPSCEEYIFDGLEFKFLNN